MILTCPDCSTRYSAPDGAVGPNGRTVRCANCGTTWFVSAEPDIFELRDNQVPELEPVSAPAGDAQTHSVLPEPSHTPDPLPRTVEEPAVGAHVQIRDKADQVRRNRRLIGVSMIWFVTLGLLLIAAVLAYLFRQPIVNRVPAAASIYKAVGVPVKLAGLDFELPKTRNAEIDGVPTLLINGYIINRSSETQTVPMIELSLYDNSGQVLNVWAVEPPKPVLKSKERAEYVSQLPNPPIDAVSLKYRFLDEREGFSSPISVPPNAVLSQVQNHH